MSKQWLMIATYSEADALNLLKLVESFGAKRDPNGLWRFRGEDWVIVYGGQSIPSIRAKEVFVSSMLKVMTMKEFNSNDRERIQLNEWLNMYVRHRLPPGKDFTYL